MQFLLVLVPVSELVEDKKNPDLKAGIIKKFIKIMRNA